MPATEIEYVTEKDFFKISGTNPIGPNNAPAIPSTPWVLVQFRTAVLQAGQSHEDFLKTFQENGGYDIEKHSTWTTVSFRRRTDGYTPNSNLKEELENGGSLKFNNFFENVDLEDNGGLINCTLKLYDPDFGNLENIILKSILSMKAANKYYENRLSARDSYMLQFHSGAPQNINFRIRFGYADATTSSEEIIDEASNSQGEFSARANNKNNKNKTTIRSTWKYFQMMDCKFSVANSGMFAEVKGISIGTSMFDRLKIVQRFAMLRGTPENLIREFGKRLFVSSNGMIQFANFAREVKGETVKPDVLVIHPLDDEGIQDEIGSESISELRKLVNEGEDEENYDFYSTAGKTWNINGEGDEFETWLTEQYGNENAEGITDAESQRIRDMKKTQRDSEANMYRIEVMYGAEPTPQTDRNGRVVPGVTTRTYQSIKQLLYKICSKVPPIYRYEVDGEERYVENNGDVKRIFTGDQDPVEINGEEWSRGIFQPIKYSFVVKEISVGEKSIIRIAFNYDKPKLDKQAFIRKYTWRNNKNNLISSFAIASEFDFAQMSTSIAIVNNDEIGYYMAPPNSNGNEDSNTSGAFSGTDFDPTANNSLRLVHSIIENTEASGGEQGEIERRTMAQQLIDNMNSQVFRGNIEIPGDPFFQFDSAMEPYKYGIYIEVLRDFNYYGQTPDEPNEKSYMSGLYLIKKIRHSLSAGGFKTTLEVDKWPTQTVKLVESTDR